MSNENHGPCKILASGSAESLPAVSNRRVGQLDCGGATVQLVGDGQTVNKVNTAQLDCGGPTVQLCGRQTLK